MLTALCLPWPEFLAVPYVFWLMQLCSGPSCLFFPYCCMPGKDMSACLSVLQLLHYFTLNSVKIQGPEDKKKSTAVSLGWILPAKTFGVNISLQMLGRIFNSRHHFNPLIYFRSIVSLINRRTKCKITLCGCSAEMEQSLMWMQS